MRNPTWIVTLTFALVIAGYLGLVILAEDAAKGVYAAGIDKTAVQEPEKIGPPKAYQPEPGYYICTGGQEHKLYEMVLTIKESPAKRGVYIVQWSNTYTGVGRMEGDTFIVGWSGNGCTGFTTYKGVWDTETKRHRWEGKQLFIPSDGELYPEKLEYLRPFKVLKKERE
ncbi:MAG: hypothetical protein KGZ65_02590 [Sphingomonadales bacterium]|nr:hypothetical protein [Sphingomonadaceae bacterium]MBS3930093.1 hypothetical protein [Sphingomonadales bacterium]